jgi:hypothetical protein
MTRPYLQSINFGRKEAPRDITIHFSPFNAITHDGIDRLMDLMKHEAFTFVHADVYPGEAPIAGSIYDIGNGWTIFCRPPFDSRKQDPSHCKQGRCACHLTVVSRNRHKHTFFITMQDMRRTIFPKLFEGADSATIHPSVRFVCQLHLNFLSVDRSRRSVSQDVRSPRGLHRKSHSSAPLN